MVIETILGVIVGVVFAWLFVYSAALFGAKHALREQNQRDEVEGIQVEPVGM